MRNARSLGELELEKQLCSVWRLITFCLQVDICLQSGFAPGMKLEVALRKDPETYWVATVITACEQLLLLRYEGYGEDRKADFWCDIRRAGLYPIGWCQQNKKTLEAPEGQSTLRD